MLGGRWGGGAMTGVRFKNVGLCCIAFSHGVVKNQHFQSTYSFWEVGRGHKKIR